MHVGDGLKGLRGVERLALGKCDQHVDGIGAGELGVEPVACGNRLALVRHLVGEPVARLQIGVDDAEAADEEHRDQAEQAGPADHAHRDPVAEISQGLDAGIGALELDREDLLVAHEQHAEHRYEREHREQRDDGGGKARLAEFADQVGV